MPVALGLGDDVEGERGLAAALRAEDLDDAAARHAPDAEGQVERQGTGGDGGDRLDLVGPELHDGALAELPLDLGDGHVQGLVPFHWRSFAMIYPPTVGGGCDTAGGNYNDVSLAFCRPPG